MHLPCLNADVSGCINHTGIETTALAVCSPVHPLQADGHYQSKHLITSLMAARSWLTLVNGYYNHLGTVSVLYHTATACSPNNRLVWLAYVCGTTCPKITTPDWQLALLANILKCHFSLLHKAVEHL